MQIHLKPGVCMLARIDAHLAQSAHDIAQLLLPLRQLTWDKYSNIPKVQAAMPEYARNAANGKDSRCSV